VSTVPASVGAPSGRVDPVSVPGRRVRSRYAPYSLGVRDAAEHVGISRTRLEDALALGQVSAVKAGRRTLVIVESLESWIASLPAR
jgi:hypothetical protein